MLSFAILCLCVSSICALPSSAGRSKVFPVKFTGSRIINGEVAEEGQFPWQVALFVEGPEFSWFCGGSIIGAEWILTAGHCINGALSADIIAGTTSPYTGIGASASRFILHEDYNEEQLSNDIGLIQLEDPLSLGGNVAAVSLASEELEADVQVTVSGWGLTSDDANTISDELNFVGMVTISQSDCQDEYAEDNIGQEMICATSPTSDNKNTCSGDSGGPVVTDADTNPIHVAIVSFGSDVSCEDGVPSGYTRTAYFRDWIRTNTGI